MLILCVQTHVHVYEGDYEHCEGFAQLVFSYLSQRRADVYFGFEDHDQTALGFTSSSLVLTSVQPLLISKDNNQSFSYSRNNVMSSQKCMILSYGCSPQQMDAFFLFDFG